MSPDPVSPIPVSPAANPSPVDVDLAADKAGEPRPTEPAPLPPPGTELTTFWQAGATKGAIVATLTGILAWSRATITGTPLSPETIALLVELDVWAWAAAFGIHKVDTSALRWK